MKNIFIASLTFFFLQPLAVYAQSEMAFASQHGIFVKLEVDYPVVNNSQPPVYEIKRKAEGDKNFKRITTINPPTTYAEFLENLAAACNINPEPLLMKEIPAELLWQKYSKGGFDSIQPYRNALFLQLALGIKYFDATAEKNVKYTYEITKTIKAIKSEVVATTNAISYPIAPLKYEGNLSKTKETVIGISLNYLSATNAPNLIRVYREENYSGNFLPVRAKRIKTIKNDSTYFAIYDTLVKPNSVYRYYVLPLDYYGNYGIVSDTVTAIAASLQYAGNINKIDVVSYQNEGTAIRWELGHAQNFNAVAVYRTNNFDSTMQKIGMASAMDTQYIDANAEPMQMYFYALQPITRTGEKLPMSAKVTGMFTPKTLPAAPYISDITTSAHAITLQIKNNDTQTRGFRIYRKLNTDSTYTLISELVNVDTALSTYIDSLNIMPGKFYSYMVRAENKSYQLSPASNQVTVKSATPNELIPIGVPHVEVVANAAVIQWKNNIKNENIQSYILYRKDEAGNEIILKDNINPTVANYSDNTLLTGKNYAYGIAYQDGNGSRSKIAYAQTIKIASTAFGPTTVYGAYHEGIINISWNKSDSDVVAYKLYQVKTEQPALLAQINKDENSYTITNIKQGEIYNVYLTTVNKENVESMPGKMISIYAE